MTQTPQFPSITSQPVETQDQQLPSQQIAPEPALNDQTELATTVLPATNPLKRNFTRILAIVLILALVVALYATWHAPSSTNPPPVIAQQNFSGTSSNSGSSTGSPLISNGDIHVYVVGSVKHPGVYILPSGARVYQLLQAAGGALPDANLVALNLAAPLSDGEEVYVLANGEKPPTYVGGVPGTSGSATTGQLVNINTASVDEMRQSLHISSTTAQSIDNYRQQHGPYTSIDQLQMAVSKSIYDKIKGLITV